MRFYLKLTRRREHQRRSLRAFASSRENIQGDFPLIRDDPDFVATVWVDVTGSEEVLALRP
jgi:hypothetical protein